MALLANDPAVDDRARAVIAARPRDKPGEELLRRAVPIEEAPSPAMLEHTPA